MPKPISPLKRARIINAVQYDGMKIRDAAKAYSVSEQAIGKWLRTKTCDTYIPKGETARLRHEIRELKEIIGDMKLEEKRRKIVRV